MSSVLRMIRRLGNLHWRPSYSQYGEDMVAAGYLKDVSRGFYVDIGAHHPKRFSNTQYFHLKGWRGINVDAVPGTMRAFNAARPRDINLELGIGAEPAQKTFFVFDEPALNTFEKTVADGIVREGKYKLLSTPTVQVQTLRSILDQWLPAGQSIDLMSIDVEGWELEVLKSNDWGKYVPRVILVELNDSDVSTAMSAGAPKFLGERGYSLVGKTFNTLVMLRRP